jgi:hypothetical protein
MYKVRRHSLWTLVAAATMVACGSSMPTAPSGGGAASPTTSGVATVMLQDSPFSDAKAVLVTFSEVSVHLSGGDFVTLPFASGGSRTCDLKKLVGAQDVLGTGPLAPGHYTQIRLVVSGAVIYFDNASSGTACARMIGAPAGRSAPVDVPSGDVRLNREFDLTTAQTTITLDFDGDQSIKQTGNGKYMMNPVVAVVSVR